MESFLKEQLRRIQELAAQMSSLEKQAAELTNERGWERERSVVSHGPLADVKDLRTYSSVSGRREPRETAADSPRRKSKRRR